jgi:hypothetical protein
MLEISETEAAAKYIKALEVICELYLQGVIKAFPYRIIFIFSRSGGHSTLSSAKANHF